MSFVLNEWHERYLHYLRELTQYKTNFEEPAGVEQCMQYCFSVFTEHLDGYTVSFDAQNNIIAVPYAIDTSKNIVYLSAHVDTVDATAEQWDAPFTPWNLYEDETQMVMRGINDCKAGVAYQLFLSDLVQSGDVELQNVVCTLTFKEEGAGNKTATAIGSALGHALPLSQQLTYLLVLENTVSVEDPSVASVYVAERSSYAISIEGTLLELQTHLQTLQHWNPVSVEPLSNTELVYTETRTQQGGHVCSIPRQENQLVSVLMQADACTIVSAGSRTNVASVPSVLRSGATDTPVVHRMVLSNRSFDSLHDVQQQLTGISYTEEKKLELSTGFNKEATFYEDSIADAFRSCSSRSSLEIDYTHNIGASDATIILQSTEPQYQDCLLPIVLGPGSRSQRSAIPPRLTHGRNETFDKKSGLQCVDFITDVLREMKFVNVL